MIGPSDRRGKADLDSLLAQLPPPDMPEGLAARIVRDVTRLPQVAAQEPGPPPEAPVTLPAQHRRRWVAWFGGGTGMALAASLAAAFLLPSATRPDTPPTASPPADIAPVAAQAEPSVSSPSPAIPRLAADSAKPVSPAPGPSAPSAAAPAPAQDRPPPAEVASGAPAATAPSLATPTDSIEADDEAELVDKGNDQAPTPLPGPTPAPRGWGFAPDAAPAYPRADPPASRPDEPMGPHRRGRRF